jgi:hypothetical protein
MLPGQAVHYATDTTIARRWRAIYGLVIEDASMVAEPMLVVTQARSGLIQIVLRITAAAQGEDGRLGAAA